MFTKWIDTVIQSHGAVCISKQTAEDLECWITKNASNLAGAFAVDWNHLGSDIVQVTQIRNCALESDGLLPLLREGESFVMIGTLEPRKGHVQVLDAFEQLWHSGADINLVIVGKQGWMVEDLVARLSDHIERNKRLFWLQGISDKYLRKIYTASTCLIAASYGEGFGLPLVEAAQYKLPIIARDIPVFREVAGDYAWYFSADTPDELADSIRDWLVAYEKDEHPKTDDMSWLTWKESADNLLSILLESNKEAN